MVYLSIFRIIFSNFVKITIAKKLKKRIDRSRCKYANEEY